MVKFKKHKFISKEKLASTFLNKQWYDINIGLKYSTADQNQIVKTGYAQYSVIDKENNDIFIRAKSKKEDDSTINYYPNVTLKELWKIEGFEYLKHYGEIGKAKIIYKFVDERTREIINSDLVPQGRHYFCELIGILIK